MPDSDDRGHAWRVPPSRYLATRPAVYEIPQPSSRYLTMPDGCRIAADIYLPQGSDAQGRKWPTILICTPYYRRFKIKAGASTEPCPNTFRYRDMFVPRGYALVVVDVRGSGASFGTRDSFRSPREREDCSVIADWIVSQSWSDGRIGATGVSYLGAASDFLASTGHPAVKAIAPLFAVWDTYADNYYPGGILLKELAKVYDGLMVGLDHDRRDVLRTYSYYADPNLEGPHPVDEDEDGSLCRAAVREHIANFRMPDFIAEFKFRDDTLPYDESFTSAKFGPYNYASGVREDVAVYAVSGWTDGAGYANGAISRFLTLPNPKKYLLLGPWDHGARVNTSPWREGIAPQFTVLAEILRFFDEHLAGMPTGLKNESPVHFFTYHEEAWRESKSWPPIQEAKRFYVAATHELSGASAASGADTYQVDFGLGTGNETRYERIAGIDSTRYYTDWQGRADGMLSYTTAPIDKPLEMSGHALASLWISSSEPDAALFVYLTEIEADGTARYVTEGLLRALHRKESPCPPNYRTSWPYRTFTRADAEPMSLGRPQLLRIPLLPVSWAFRTGSRLRFSIAGADADHCGQVPHGRPPKLTVHWGGETASYIELPANALG